MSQQLEQIPADVRRSYRLRDDNVGITCNWPAGLLRRATAGAGGALRDAGLLDDPALAFHLNVSELAQACDERANRWNDVATARAIQHRLSAAAFPPVELDGDHVSHTRAQLPEHVARVAAAFMTYSDPLPRVRDRDGLRGIGVGTAKVRGRARVAHDALEASEQIEPDEILVTTLTDSAFNALLPMVAGLVTAHGGAMSHAALMARELGISAIVGVADAVSRIPDGCLLELDPTEGIARMVNASGPVTGAE